MTLARLLGSWALLAVLMSANGIVREAVVRPRVGPAQADVLSAASGILIVLLATAVAFRPLAGAPPRTLALTSLALVALTVAFECAMGRLVDHKSWSELAANYALWRGRLWPLVLLIVAITPFLWGRWAPFARPTR